MRILLSGIAAAALAIAPAAASAQSFEGEIDLFEMQLGDGEDPIFFDSSFRLGDDVQGAVLKIEGGSPAGPELDEVVTQLFYARNLSPSTTVMIGARHDFLPAEDLSFAGVAIEQALGDNAAAESYVYISEHGDVLGTGELIVSLPLAAGLSLEPRLAVEWAAQDIAQEDIGAGLVGAAATARLRKAITDNFDIYVGATHERLLGDTRDIARAAGDDPDTTRALIGAGARF